ncbi:MAG: hypothetical protein IPN63_07580 [Gammaproteobacteria bacterium]|nr:hypothetical protein [Gammaproteobacteria bacterium]
MMTLHTIRQALKDRRLDKVAAATGLHPNTIRDIRDNEDANPTWRVLSALSEYLEGGGAAAAERDSGAGQ